MRCIIMDPAESLNMVWKDDGPRQLKSRVATLLEGCRGTGYSRLISYSIPSCKSMSSFIVRYFENAKVQLSKSPKASNQSPRMHFVRKFQCAPVHLCTLSTCAFALGIPPLTRTLAHS